MTETWQASKDQYGNDGRAEIWVDAVARIRKNETGEVREYATQVPLDHQATVPSEYIWADGNYQCDCNRRLFFARAKGEPEEDADCSDGLYSVQLVNPVTGTVFYNEFDGDAYRHKDCGGVLIPDILGKVKLLHPCLYRHRCAKCGFEAWANLKKEARSTPAFVQKT